MNIKIRETVIDTDFIIGREEDHPVIDDNIGAIYLEPDWEL